MKVKKISISGDPRECGQQYGSQCKELIHICIENYKKFIFNDTRMNWEMACKAAMRYEKSIMGFRPEYIEEMKGIAEGAQVEYAEIMAINCRSELRAMSDAIPLECTTMAVMPSVSADGHTYTGQNWDNNFIQRECMVIVQIHETGKPTVMLFTEAGFIGGKGINDSGVSLLLNALFVGYEFEGIPLHIKMRGALDSTNISDAYSVAAQGMTGAGGNLMLGTDGAAISEELTLHEVDGILPTGGIITHTNHILSPRLQSIPDQFRTNGSSFLRLARADELLRSQTRITKEYLFELFRDQVGYPHGICTHAIGNVAPEKQYSTNYSVLFDNTDKIAYYCAGYPDEGEYEKYSF